MEYSPVACMRQSSRCCRSESLGCLPRNFPLSRAMAMPSRVRSRMRSASNSAKVARMANTGGQNVEGGLSVRFCPLPESTRGWEWNCSQSSEGATELGFPGPALGKMQSEAACRACEPAGHREEASSEGLGGHNLLAQTDARCPAGQVMGHHLDGQPSGVGGEASRGEMVEPHAVLEVSDGVLDVGVAAMVGLQFQGIPLPVGDEAMIAVAGEEGQLEPGVGFTLRTMSRTGVASGLTLEGG